MKQLRRGRSPREQDVHRITDARRSHADDQHDRIVKYTVSMTIRMICLVLALVVRGPLQWVFIAGAVVLPYVAVVIANASREQAPQAPDTWGLQRPELAAGGSASESGDDPDKTDGPSLTNS